MLTHIGASFIKNMTWLRSLCHSPRLTSTFQIKGVSDPAVRAGWTVGWGQAGADANFPKLVRSRRNLHRAEGQIGSVTAGLCVAFLPQMRCFQKS